jgi:predicted metalloprotease with PDZ domain
MPQSRAQRLLIALFPCFLMLCAAAFSADSPAPQPAPLPPAIPTPVDKPYPGMISVQVDLTDTIRGVVSVHETIPVASGPLTLLYPQWIPGHHSPTGPLSKLGGLFISAEGTRIDWVRDRGNPFAFHLAVPRGVKSLAVDFQYLSPVRSRDGRVSNSPEIADLQWNTVVLYPAGYFDRRIQFSPSVRLPEGWQFASSLTVSSQTGSLVQFHETTLETLVDSPLYAGINFKRVDLSTSPANQVFLNLFGDTPANIAITPEQIELHRNLVKEAQKLYASHHYDHYDFLFLISDKVGGIGLEHHQSSEDGTRANYFTDWAAGVEDRDLLGHEYTHSWNGKFRRPADLWTPNFDVPMQDDLLWVYEGMTEYWGFVLTARSGLSTPAQIRDRMAMIAANFDISPGRTWRPLVDTTNQPTISQRSPVSWVSWQRPEDYYTEGMLIWLDADTKIREMSNGQKSLDDFARLFFGVDDGNYVPHTYTFDDVAAALNKVQPYDWATFLHTRVDQLAPQTPKDGLTRGGYRLSYSDTPPDWLKHVEESEVPPSASFAFSLGIVIGAEDTVGNVWWNSPAFQAGIIPGMRIVAVNDEAYKAARLRDAIVAAEKNSTPIRLLLRRGDHFQTVSLDYHGGLHYPKLERIEGSVDLLDAILAPAK